jgi:hypothetical protein
LIRKMGRGFGYGLRTPGKQGKAKKDADDSCLSSHGFLTPMEGG